MKPHWEICVIIALCVTILLTLAAVQHDLDYRDACALLHEHEWANVSLRLEPRLIHLQWRTSELPTTGIRGATARGFRTLFPGHEIRIWNDSAMRALVERWDPAFIPWYDGYPEHIQRVDAARYYILWQYGGLYADLDFVPLRDYWRHLHPRKPSIVESPFIYAERVQNSLMASPSKHPFWLEVIAELRRRAKMPGKSVVWSTGPNLVQDVLEATSWEPHILTCENWFRVPPPRWHEADVWSKFITWHSRFTKNCSPFNLNDPCMLAAHYGTSSSASHKWFYMN